MVRNRQQAFHFIRLDDIRREDIADDPPQIEIWGTHADGWLDRDGEGGNFNDGWLLIGAQTAGAIGFDNDVIPLAELGDGFQQIRVNVMGRPVTLNQLRVIYENGEEDIVPVRSRIDDGDVFGPINLRGGNT